VADEHLPYDSVDLARIYPLGTQRAGLQNHDGEGSADLTIGGDWHAKAMSLP
jgi:hypothetical protein